MVRAVAFALILAALSGCGNDVKKLETSVSNYKSELEPEMQLLTRHSKFLKKKAETIAAKVDKLEADQAQLVQSLGVLTSQPGAAKRDIMAVIESQRDSLIMFQKATLGEFGRFLDQRDIAVRQSLDAQADTLRSALASTDEFVRFVFAYQDSVNHLFAARFDQKPWYTSILGRWDAQHSPKN